VDNKQPSVKTSESISADNSDSDELSICNHPESSHFNQQYYCVECNCQSFEYTLISRINRILNRKIDNVLKLAQIRNLIDSQQKSSGTCNILENEVSELNSYSANTNFIEKILEGNWIKKRIESEFRKYHKSDIDWALEAQCKIRAQIRDELKSLKK
jgi:hypothetical protein